MEKVSLVTYSLIGMMFLLICLANLSTNQARRERFYLLYFMLLAFFLLFFTTVNAKDFTIKTWLIPYGVALGIGFAIPQLISRILIRQKVNHPVIFLKKNKVPLLGIIPAVSFLAFAAWIALMPRDYINGQPVYDEFYALSSFSFLLFFIPLVILFFEFIVERNALCNNGLYQNGLLSDWSSFRSYFWPQDKLYNDPDIQPLLNHDTLVDLELEPKKTFMSKPIRLTIPFDEKNAVENLLSKSIMVKREQ